MPVLYFLRHGETDFNVERRLQGRRDTGLNARGRQQAGHCGAVLAGLMARTHQSPTGFDYVSSPLTRARETMERLRTTLGLDPNAYEVDDRLLEIAYGDWEGMTLPEIQAGDPDVLIRRESDKWGFTPPGGECYRDVATRVALWYASLARDTVATAHGGIARVLMANFHILPEEEAVHAEILHGVVYEFSGTTVTSHT